MRAVKVHEAKTHLSAIIKDVEKGESVIIYRGNAPVAKIVPIRAGERELGFGSYKLADSFFEELPAEELGVWE